MIAMRAIAARAKIVVAVTTALIILGTGAAAAYWTAAASLDGSASAASVGMTQTQPLKLDATYSAGTLWAADAVTITNTGNRDASVRTTVSAANSQDLSKALDVRIAEVASAEACTPQAGLTGAVAGGIGLSYAPQKKLPAGQSIIVCVQTSLTPQKLFSLPAGSAQVSVTSRLTYATGAEWTLSKKSDVSQRLATDRASGAPETTCNERTVFLGDDEFTFRLKQGFASRSTDVRVFIVQNGQISALGSSAITVDRETGTVVIAEKTLVGHRAGLGQAQVVITQVEGAGLRTIAGLGRFEFRSPLGIGLLPYAVC